MPRSSGTAWFGRRLTGMKFLSTLLIATALCAGMLAVGAYRAGDLPKPQPWTGLTTAAVLGSDGTVPEGAAMSDQRLDRRALGTLFGEASSADGEAIRADGSRG